MYIFQFHYCENSTPEVVLNLKNRDTVAEVYCMLVLLLKKERFGSAINKFFVFFLRDETYRICYSFDKLTPSSQPLLFFTFSRRNASTS